MVVEINAPAVRALNANEKTVYKLLKEGKEISEIAAIMRIPITPNYNINLHDVVPDTVKGLIMSIREKGWTIETKEETEMPRGYKTSDEKVTEILRLKAEGKTNMAIAYETGVSLNTVVRTCHKEKEEPAPAATDTGSDDVFPDTQQDESPADDIIAPSAEDVKTAEKISEINRTADVAEAVALQLETLRRTLKESRSALQIALENIERRREKNRETESKIENLESWLRKNGYGELILTGGTKDV